jgi:hypothetical protein
MNWFGCIEWMADVEEQVDKQAEIQPADDNSGIPKRITGLDLTIAMQVDVSHLKS